jgi:hypothetical protein
MVKKEEYKMKSLYAIFLSTVTIAAVFYVYLSLMKIVTRMKVLREENKWFKKK